MSKTKTSARGVTAPLGFRAAGGTCGLKASGSPDLALVVADVLCSAAGVFTTNRVCGAPVIVNRHHLALTGGRARAIITNSGNSNSSTGKPGEKLAQRMAELVSDQVGCPPVQVLVNSTGIIGRLPPLEKIAPGIEAVAGKLGRGPEADAAAARAILTTDLVPKTACRTLKLGGRRVTLAGMCKGSGMIAPNMATMLAFVTTDAAIAPRALAPALRAAAAASFNRISVDQHTSPSDTLLALASGLAGHRPIQRAGGADYARFLAALTDLCRDLAYQVVKDGEGATRVFRVRVVRAASVADADRVGRAVVDSPLIKCAVHGSDPNWGRITTAAGYSGAAVLPEALSLFIGPKREVCVYRKGLPTPQGQNPGARLKALMKQREIVFTLDLGQGRAAVEWLGCDLSREYVRINADYTT